MEPQEHSFVSCYPWETGFSVCVISADVGNHSSRLLSHSNKVRIPRTPVESFLWSLVSALFEGNRLRSHLPGKSHKMLES